MSRLGFSLASFVAVGLVAACSSSSSSNSPGPSGGDAGPSSYCPADGSNSGTGAQTCTTLTQQGACYPVTYATGFTTPTGGTIADGVYVVTSATIIDSTKTAGAAAFTNAPTTLQFKSGTIERLVDPGNTGAPVAGLKASVSNQDATTLSVVVSCPTATTLSWPYSVKGTTLVIQDSNGFGESTYEKK